jgi:hypothetical protein
MAMIFALSSLVILIMGCIVLAFIVPDLLRTSTFQRNGVVPPQSKQPQRVSNFPKYTGRDGREVLVEFNAEYPQFRLEIVPPDSAVTMDFDQSRVRMHVTRAGKVIGMYIG